MYFGRGLEEGTASLDPQAGDRRSDFGGHALAVGDGGEAFAGAHLPGAVVDLERTLDLPAAGLQVGDPQLRCQVAHLGDGVAIEDDINRDLTAATAVDREIDARVDAAGTKEERRKDKWHKAAAR